MGFEQMAKNEALTVSDHCSLSPNWKYTGKRSFDIQGDSQKPAWHRRYLQVGYDPLISDLNPLTQAKIILNFSRGISEYEKQHHDASARCFQTILDVIPNHDIVLCRLGDTMYAQLNRMKQEAEAMQELPSGHLFDSGSRRILEQSEKTLDLYRKALKHNRCSSYAYNGLSLFQQSSKYKELFLRKAVLVDPRNSYALVNLSISLLQKTHEDDTDDDDEGGGEEDEVGGEVGTDGMGTGGSVLNTTDSLDAIRLNAERRNRSQRLTRAEKQKQTYANCLVLLKRAININPNLFYARMSMANVYLRMGKLHEAHSVLREHLELRSTDAEARRLYDAIDALIGD